MSQRPTPDDQVALVDLDGTLADYDAILRREMAKIQAPDEPPYRDRFSDGTEPLYIEARRKLIQRQPGFWRGLPMIGLGFEIVGMLMKIGFELHVLTKGPKTTPGAWSEKLEWCADTLPTALVTITEDKSLVYGRVLVDDYPPYFTKWLDVRPRGLVICVAQPWNEAYRKGGPSEHPNVLRYDGTNANEIQTALRRAYDRKGGEPLSAPPVTAAPEVFDPAIVAAIRDRSSRTDEIGEMEVDLVLHDLTNDDFIKRHMAEKFQAGVAAFRRLSFDERVRVVRGVLGTPEGHDDFDQS